MINLRKFSDGGQVENLNRQFIAAKKRYDKGFIPLEELHDITTYCLGLLLSKATQRFQGNIESKRYFVFESKDGISRPFLKNIFIDSVENFSQRWSFFIKKLKESGNVTGFQANEIDSILYTASMSFSMCYDIWKNSSRKTPGTYLEFLLGSILSKILIEYKRTKHIPLSLCDNENNCAEERESVSTDIVFERVLENGKKVGLVFPVKITTRERIVQPFAHQRILDGFFGEKRFLSFLMCISEMQLDKKKNKVNEICVPGTIILFQKFLSKMSGIYYLDPPLRYQKDDVKNVLSVSSVGDFLINYLPKLI